MKKKPFWVALILVGFFASWQSCYYDNNAELHPDSGTPSCDTTGVISFSTDIKPILNNSCGIGNSCHGSNNTSGIPLHTYDGVILMVDNGKFLSSVNWDGNASLMPQNSDKIADCSIAKISKWIEEGAQDN